MIWLTLVLPTTFSEAIALEIAQRTSAGYLGTQVFAGLMYVVAAACLYVVRTRRVKPMAMINPTEESEEGQMNDVASKSMSIRRRMVAWQKI